MSKKDWTSLDWNYHDWNKQPKTRRGSFEDFHAVRMTKGWAFLNLPEGQHEKDLEECRKEAREYLNVRQRNTLN